MIHDPKILECAEPSRVMFEEVRKNAALADDGNDSLLLSYFKAAFREVQAHADASLLRCTIEVCEDEREDNAPVRLYQTPDEIVSVIDGYGQPLAYRREGKLIYPARHASSVTVRYTTKPDPADAQRLAPYVNMYATALFDGEVEKLNSILAQCL